MGKWAERAVHACTAHYSISCVKLFPATRHMLICNFPCISELLSPFCVDVICGCPFAALSLSLSLSRKVQHETRVSGCAWVDGVRRDGKGSQCAATAAVTQKQKGRRGMIQIVFGNPLARSLAPRPAAPSMEVGRGGGRGHGGHAVTME